jgi:hypothetical protein
MDARTGRYTAPSQIFHVYDTMGGLFDGLVFRSFIGARDVCRQRNARDPHRGRWVPVAYSVVAL